MEYHHHPPVSLPSPFPLRASPASDGDDDDDDEPFLRAEDSDSDVDSDDDVHGSLPDTLRLSLPVDRNRSSMQVPGP